MPGKPSVPDETNLPRPIMLVVSPQHDGLLTLSLDAPGTGSIPLELGAGFQTFEQVLAVVQASLTAPAVAEDRMQLVEEAAGVVNQLVDAVNDLVNQVATLGQRVEYLEQVSGTGGSSLPRGRIPRLGERRPPPQPTPRTPAGQYHDMQNVWDAELGMPRQEPQAPPRPPAPPRKPAAAQANIPRERDLTVSSAPRPDFSRGSFQPHQPVGRVSRGPGSPDTE